MPVRNEEKFVARAIKSILAQTYSDFEFIIVDDASTDNTVHVMKEFSDSRINLIQLEQNVGLPAALNAGLNVASGRWIARMDGDDVSDSSRLQIQREYLQAHPEIDVLGTNMSIVDESQRTHRRTHLPLEHYEIVWQSLFINPVAHPTVMMRKSTVLDVSGYLEESVYAEDFDLWLRLFSVARFHNLPDFLYSYTKPKHFLQRDLKSKDRSIRATRLKFITRLIGSHAYSKLAHHLVLIPQTRSTRRRLSQHQVKQLVASLVSIYNAMIQAEYFHQEEIAKIRSLLAQNIMNASLLSLSLRLRKKI